MSDMQLHMDIFDDFALSGGTQGTLGINLVPAPSSLSTDPTLQVFTGSLTDSQYDFFPFSLSVVAVVSDTVYGDENEIISLLADNQGVAFRVFQTNHMNLLTTVVRLIKRFYLLLWLVLVSLPMHIE